MTELTSLIMHRIFSLAAFQPRPAVSTWAADFARWPPPFCVQAGPIRPDALKEFRPYRHMGVQGSDSKRMSLSLITGLPRDLASVPKVAAKGSQRSLNQAWLTIGADSGPNLAHRRRVCPGQAPAKKKTARTTTHVGNDASCACLDCGHTALGRRRLVRPGGALAGGHAKAIAAKPAPPSPRTRGSPATASAPASSPTCRRRSTSTSLPSAILTGSSSMPRM